MTVVSYFRVALLLPVLLLIQDAGAQARAANTVQIPAGVFMPLFRGEDDAREIPVHSFRIATTPVTNSEYLEFVLANPRWRKSAVKRIFADAGYLQLWRDDLDFGGEAAARQPVVFVSWFAAKAYCQWRGGRLPLNAEWELVAGAGYLSVDGSKEADFRADIEHWYGAPNPVVSPPVASRRANFHGVYDLHGLVWEWTSDFNSSMVTGDARGDSGLDRQLFCGAGALGATDRANYPAFMRYGFRSSLKANYTVHNLGFRCAFDL